MGSHAKSAPSADPVITYSSSRAESSPADVRLLHFNDVYHLDQSSAEPVGGVARFMTVCDEYRNGEQFRGQPDLIALFSGDTFSPSLESSISKGSHMVPILNKIETACACIGNHDLDFGVLQFENLASKCNFPWLLANVIDPADNAPLGHAAKTHVMTCANGIKIGLMGLAEREWLDTVNSLPPNLEYRSATAVALELAPRLRDQGCDLVVALTHMREHNDIKLARQTRGVLDLVLGGHDHFYSHTAIEVDDGEEAGAITHVLRSGSDFKQLSYLELRRSTSRSGRWDVDIWRRDMVSSIVPDSAAAALVDRLTARLKTSLQRPVGCTSTPLDARFTTVRSRESNLGNLVCDIMRHHHAADCALMAAGTIRGDQIYAPGPIRVKDIADCFPFEDPVVVLRVSGKAMVEALENGVSLYPALEGRFPQVSGIVFSFDPSRPAGSRIVSIKVNGESVEPHRPYTLATRGYMARGKDGYTSLLARSEGGECEEVVSEENGMLISMMLRQYFMALKTLDRWRHWSSHMDRHWGRVVEGCAACSPTMVPSCPASVEGNKGLTERTEEGGEDEDEDEDDLGPVEEESTATLQSRDRELHIMRRVARKWCRLAGVRTKECDGVAEENLGIGWTKAISPRAEGRICMVGGTQ